MKYESKSLVLLAKNTLVYVMYQNQYTMYQYFTEILDLYELCRPRFLLSSKFNSRYITLSCFHNYFL